MEAVPHGIGVQNRYALFYDEGLDPLEILKLTEEQKTKKKTEKTVKVKNTKPAAAPKKPAEIVPAKVVKAAETDVSKPKGKPILQSKVSNPIDSRENDKNTRNREDGYFGGESRENSEFRRGRGGFRGRGGPSRGRGFYNAADNKNRRVFDRKSGNDKTGVRPVEKREGAGANNWGDIRSDCNSRREETTWDEEFEGDANPRQEFNSSGDENINEFGKTEDPKNDSVEGTETKENDQTLDEQAQDAMKEMTLDEYKKEQEAKRAVPKYNLRKPGEGEDDKQWKKGYVLKKKPKEDDDDDQDEDDDIEDEDYGRKAQQKVLLDIQFNFADSRRGNRGRGRGGRGGPRSGPRDAPREDRPRGNRVGGTPKGKGQQAAPRVDDFNDFPSLINA